jgi:excinuclease UvrABC nuclease subunit
MKKKFNAESVSKIPNNKPVVYKIKTSGGKVNYIGIAKRGQANERPADHIGNIPGTILEVMQYDSIAEARAAEERAIKREGPKYNKQHSS